MAEQDNIPDWVKRKKREKEEEERKAEAEHQRQLAASKVVGEKGPDFWKHFVDQVGNNVRALKELEGEELVGMMSHENNSAELHCYIQVNRQSVKWGPELSQMNLWYRPGTHRIRRWYQNADAGDIELISFGNEVRAKVDRSGPFTAEQLADRLVEWMAEQVSHRNFRSYV